MVGLLEPRFGVAGKIARRAREEGQREEVRHGMVGVVGEEEGEVRVTEKEQVEEVVEEVGGSQGAAGAGEAAAS